MGFLDSLFGGADNHVEKLKVPEWWEDPNYRQTQDFLQPLGMDILGGKIPDYYKPIGEFGGDEFEKYLALTNRDISLGASEAMARSGRARGGALPAVTSQLIADNTTKARYADFERALKGRAGLFDAGVGITEGVRGAGLTNQAQKNTFNLESFDKAMQQAEYMDTYESEHAKNKGQMIGTILGGGVGFIAGGPAGALQGAGIGSSLMGGGTEDLLSAYAKRPTIPNASLTGPLPGVSKFGSIGNASDAGAMSGFYKALNPSWFN
jgi:hypothetical protein